MCSLVVLLVTGEHHSGHQVSRPVSFEATPWSSVLSDCSEKDGLSSSAVISEAAYRNLPALFVPARVG